MESRRCAEHGLSFLPAFWGMLFEAGAGGDAALNWEWHLASVLGIQTGSSEMQIQNDLH